MLVGDRDGEFVGADDEGNDGPNVGLIDGEMVGEYVGNRVGFSVGPKVDMFAVGLNCTDIWHSVGNVQHNITLIINESKSRTKKQRWEK